MQFSPNNAAVCSVTSHAQCWQSFKQKTISNIKLLRAFSCYGTPIYAFRFLNFESVILKTAQAHVSMKLVTRWIIRLRSVQEFVSLSFSLPRVVIAYIFGSHFRCDSYWIWVLSLMKCVCVQHENQSILMHMYHMGTGNKGENDVYFFLYDRSTHSMPAGLK